MFSPTTCWAQKHIHLHKLLAALIQRIGMFCARTHDVCSAQETNFVRWDMSFGIENLIAGFSVCMCFGSKGLEMCTTCAARWRVGSARKLCRKSADGTLVVTPKTPIVLSAS